jgi:hypothetical protein
MVTIKYLVIGALPFTYMGNDLTKVDGISTVVPADVEGLYVYIQCVSSHRCYALTLTGEYKNIEEGKWENKIYWTYASYGKWELREVSIDVLYSMSLVPRDEYFITLLLNQCMQENIQHPLFSVSLYGDDQDGYWDIETDKWKPIKD